MFKLKLFSFATKDKSGSLFEVGWSPDRPTSAVSRHRIGFRSAQRHEIKPEPRRRFYLSIIDALFTTDKEK